MAFILGAIVASPSHDFPENGCNGDSYKEMMTMVMIMVLFPRHMRDISGGDVVFVLLK